MLLAATLAMAAPMLGAAGLPDNDGSHLIAATDPNMQYIGRFVTGRSASMLFDMPVG